MFDLIIAILLLGGAFLIGTSIEKKHFKDLRKREARLNTMPWNSIGKKAEHKGVVESKLFTGAVVVGQDYFKSFLAGLINFFGGRITVYESLLDRGRREALCRLREKSLKWGASELIHVRFETATLGLNSGKSKKGNIEVLAYGTALKK